MKYHNITKDDMLNGNGLRVVLWVSGCEHHCKGCQNPITWNPDDGEDLTTGTLMELFCELEKDYVDGITFSGGDPMYEKNRYCIYYTMQFIKEKFPNKTIWLYTGYSWNQIMQDEEMKEIAEMCDVIIDGKYVESLRDVTLHWKGSSNQRVIDVQKSIEQGKIILWEDKNAEFVLG